ncbi:MAG: hypothetical protein PHE77_03695 [Candidatus Pacebacteria bacterium]|nr:hypothetical protein [Candidatus Paceibacterota bacterium]
MKKNIIVSLAVIALVLGTIGFYATNNVLAKGPKNSIQASFAKSIIKQSGIITGKVSSTAASSFNITAKKTTYTVNVSSTSIIVNRVWDKINLGDIKAGDSVQIAGSIASSTIEATLIIDNSLPPVIERSLSGSVKSTTTNSLVLLVKNQEYTVNISPTSLIFNNVWGKINLGDIKSGDRLATFGAVNGTIVNAKMIRLLGNKNEGESEDDD